MLRTAMLAGVVSVALMSGAKADTFTYAVGGATEDFSDGASIRFNGILTNVSLTPGVPKVAPLDSSIDTLVAIVGSFNTGVIQTVMHIGPSIETVTQDFAYADAIFGGIAIDIFDGNPIVFTISPTETVTVTPIFSSGNNINTVREASFLETVTECCRGC
jgi:hypothetical protein